MTDPLLGFSRCLAESHSKLGRAEIRIVAESIVATRIANDLAAHFTHLDCLDAIIHKSSGAFVPSCKVCLTGQLTHQLRVIRVVEILSGQIIASGKSLAPNSRRAAECVYAKT